MSRTQLTAAQIHGAAIAERAQQMLIQIGLDVRMKSIRIAILGAAQEAQVSNRRGVEKVLQIAQHHPSAIYVARLQLSHRLDHGQRYLVLICTRVPVVIEKNPLAKSQSNCMRIAVYEWLLD